jgi:hypothetical protein
LARVSAPSGGNMQRWWFLRLLDAAEHLAAHIHEAPVWIVPCLEGGTRPARRGRLSILRFRTCCSRRERSASARL